ncbi:MAG: DUF4296 domain-containing protein [Sphingobacteriales bacterium]|nr:MAG: DUF4296 domain-containing protein [Sphingobacteriales bacterium]
MRNLLLALPFLLLACQQRQEESPMPKDKMEQLVVDLHMAEVYSSIGRDSTYSVSAKKMDSLAVYYNDVLRHHNITQDQFNEIVNWYKVNPQELDSVYAKVIPRLTEMEAKYSGNK